MVSVDTLEDNTKFSQMHEADYPILSDVSKSIANAYGARRAGGFTSSSVISGRGRTARRPRTAWAKTAGTPVEGDTNRAYGAQGRWGGKARPRRGSAARA